MKKWWAVDCETDPFGEIDIAPFIWAAYDGETTLIFPSTIEFTNWAREQDAILYAHNGGKFDWLMPGILDAIDTGSIMLINRRIARARLGKSQLRDSYLCLPVALEKFAKQKFDYSMLLKTNRAKYMPEIEQYIASDVHNLYDALVKFINAHGQRLTQASAALADWENMGGTKRRYSINHDQRFRDNYYRGGICKVIRHVDGEPGPWYVYDINSSYPHSMCDIHPLGENYSVAFGENHIIGPSFWEIKNRNTGEKRYITGWELLAMEKIGDMPVGRYVGLIPEETETLKPYVQKHHAIKRAAEKSGDKIGREIAKIFMNSLYGGYGLNPRNHVDCRIVEFGDDSAHDDGYSFYTDIPVDREIWTKEKTYMQFRDVALAASITGHARAKLITAFAGAVDPVYGDTDSMICREPGDIKIGDELGEWKLETTATKLWIAGKKLYTMLLGNGKYKSASKGVRATPQQIISASAGNDVTIVSTVPTISLTGKQCYVDRVIRKT